VRAEHGVCSRNRVFEPPRPLFPFCQRASRAVRHPHSPQQGRDPDRRCPRSDKKRGEFRVHVLSPFRIALYSRNSISEMRGSANAAAGSAS
jgi:hypothetical protein